MTPEQLAALKTELTTDPAAIGYAASINDHVTLARLVNTAKRSVDDSSPKPSSVLLSIVDISEYLLAVADPSKAALIVMVRGLPSLDLSDKSLKAWLVAIFGDTSKTVTALKKAAKRDGKRSEELRFGRVTESDIADALRT